MKPEEIRRFDRDEYPWLTPEIPTGELMQNNPGYKVRRIHDTDIVREVYTRQLIDKLLHDLGIRSFENSPPSEQKRIEKLLPTIEAEIERAVDYIVWSIQTQTNEIVKIFDVNKIRRLTAADAEAFQSLYLHGLATLPWAFGSTFAEEQKKGIDEVGRWIESREVFGIHHKDYRDEKRIKLVGIGRLEPQQGVFSKVGYMGSLYVDPEFWGNGFGDALTRHRLDRAVELGMSEVEMTVTTKNSRVLEYFEGLGFRKVRNREGRIGNSTYAWTDLNMPLNLWIKRKQKEAKSKLGVTDTPLPTP